MGFGVTCCIAWGFGLRSTPKFRGPNEAEFWDRNMTILLNVIKAFSRVLLPNWYLCWNVTLLSKAKIGTQVQA